MRITLLLLVLQTCVCVPAQTFNRTYGQSFPWEEVAGGKAIELNGQFYSLFRQRHLNTYDAFLVFQAIDDTGDTLFTTALFDTVHPYSPADFEKSRITDHMYASGLRANYQPLPYTHDWLAKYDPVGDTLWYKQQYTPWEPTGVTSSDVALGYCAELLTMFDRRNTLARQVEEEVRTHFGDRVFRTAIPRQAHVPEPGEFLQECL